MFAKDRLEGPISKILIVLKAVTAAILLSLIGEKNKFSTRLTAKQEELKLLKPDSIVDPPIVGG